MNADQIKEILNFEAKMADRDMEKWFNTQIALLEDAKKKIEAYRDQALKVESYNDKASIVGYAVNNIQQQTRYLDTATGIAAKLATVATLQSMSDGQ